MKNWRIIAIALLVLLLSLVPYGIAARSGSGDFAFAGFLINPIDGNSYLAKMYQGWAGSWTFTLPYTAEPGTGTYLFLFYLFLGHVARWTGLSLLAVFHGVRLLAIVAMLAALWGFFKQLFLKESQAQMAFLIAGLGSGSGWLAYPLLGLFTPDFWVPEAYPFLSAYANPHFPLSLALILWLFTTNQESVKWGIHLLRGLAGLLLAILLPFGVIIAGLALGLMSAWQWIATRRLEWKTWAFPAIGGAPVLIYQFWLTRSNPLLAGWNAQNITVSPSLVDLIISLSPVLILAIAGAIMVVKRGMPVGRILIVWAAASLALIYSPFLFQRRFMLSLFIPLAGLAVWGLDWLARGNPRRFNFYGFILALLSFPTILLVLLGGLKSIQTHDSSVYLTRGEALAMDWIQGNTAQDAVILASPETGLYIPAHTGRRVIYGHPMETVDAAINLVRVEDFFKGDVESGNISTTLSRWGVNYVFDGPREKLLGLPPSLQGLDVVYQYDGVTIYKTSLP